MTRTRLALTLFAATSLLACGDDTPGPDDDAAPVILASASIGAGGGQLRTPDDSVVPGVRLSIPAGALAKDTTITIERVLDDTPLPPGAVRIGPQLLLGPVGTTLALAGTLTLPFEDTLAAPHVIDNTSCKIWQREGDTWAVHDAEQSTESSVTVSVSRLDTAAAGVKVLIKKPLCTSPVCGGVLPAFCGGNVTGFCITALPALTFRPFRPEQLTVAGNAVYYLHVPATGKITVVKYDLAGNTQTKFPELVASPTAVFDELVVDDAGDVWATLEGIGHVRFRMGSAPTRFDNGLGKFPNGVVQAPDKVLRFLRRDNRGSSGKLFWSVTDGPTTHEIYDIMGNQAMHFRRREGVTSGAALLARAQGDGIALFSFQAGRLDFTTGDQFRTNILDVATSPTGAGYAYSFFAPRIRWFGDFDTARAGLEDVTIAVPDDEMPFNSTKKLNHMAFDDDEVLYGIQGFTTDLHVFDKAGGVSVNPLTDAADDTPELDAFAARALVANRGKNELIFAGGVSEANVKLYRIKRNAP